ncbi:DUF4349 domain-containing protein [Candidatus Woesearchaeota archaeon]|nr:DUF4349 domain-containing protein [Candidatus Woesearchaeota archaeon]
MTMKDQLLKLKENWLLIAILVVVVVMMSGGSNVMNKVGGVASFATDSMMMEQSYRGIAPPMPGYGGDFAPEVEERVILRTASIGAEVERGEFKAAEQRLRGIISSADGFILNENANKNGEGKSSYYRGSYQLKIPLNNYESTVEQLKTLGEVKSFNENTIDVTGRYVSIEDEIKTEKGRLVRFEQMLKDADRVEDKIELTDRIYSLERRIMHLEDSRDDIDERVDFTTVSVSLTEERSGYANMHFVKFSELVKSFVESLSNLFRLIFVGLPWLIALAIIAFFWKLFKRKA